MAIVPIIDSYTDTASAGQVYSSVPVPINPSQAVVVAHRGGLGGGPISLAGRLGVTSSVPSIAGSQARLYTFSTTGWERTDPVQLPVDTSNSRAATTTMEGNVLVQGTFQGYADPEYAEQIAIGTIDNGAGSFLGDLFNRMLSQGITYRRSENLTINSITVTLRGCVNYTGVARVRLQLCGSPGGHDLIASASLPLQTHTRNRAYTFPISAELNSNWRDFYVTIDGLDLQGGDAAFVAATTYLNGSTGLSDIDVMSWWFEGEQYNNDGHVMLFDIGYWGPNPFASLTTLTGYAVIGAHDTSLTIGQPTPIIDGTDGYVPCYSGPDAMARIPTTNRIWAWRTYPDQGSARIDLLAVDGLTVQALSTVQVLNGAVPATPHAIIPISTTEAISLLTLPNKITLVHLIVSGTTITASLQDISGYPYAEDATLVPGLNHHAELMLQLNTTDPTKIIRLGISWKGTSFAADSLPVTQLPATTKPTDYTPRSKTAHISVGAGTATVAHNGTVVTARPFIDNGSDDNWILLSQYNQSDGTIQANTWVKGDRNGSTKNYLHLGEPALAWNVAASRLLYTVGEYFRPTAISIPATSPRLGYYRLSYELDDAARSQRERFER